MDNLNQRTCGTKAPVASGGGCCGGNGGCSTNNAAPQDVPPVISGDTTEPSTGCCNSPKHEPESD